MINLVGHALRVAPGVLGGQQGWGLAAAERARMRADQAGIGVLASSSVKAALGCDWDDQAARQIRDQDPTVDPGGVVRIRQGVARDRRISIEAGQMRHGRKTRSRRIDGYKRHVLPRPRLRAGPLGRPDPANLPEAQVAGQIQSTWTPRAWAWRAAR
jgi:hypothetical protein